MALMILLQMLFIDNTAKENHYLLRHLPNNCFAHAQKSRSFLERLFR